MAIGLIFAYPPDFEGSVVAICHSKIGQTGGV